MALINEGASIPVTSGNMAEYVFLDARRKFSSTLQYVALGYRHEDVDGAWVKKAKALALFQ